MRAEAFAAVAVVLVAVIGVRVWESSGEQAFTEREGSGRAASLSEPHGRSEDGSPYSSGWGEEVRIAAARDHQYYVTAAVNAAPASFLVDTGASFVALRESDAERAGVYTTWADYTVTVRTANGETKAARVILDAIEIRGIRVENVKAFVLKDDQLGVNLLGMSFLSRLESVEARGGELVLRG